MMVWDDVLLNRSALAIAFVSFWLATPELLGEPNLQRLDRLVHKALDRTSNVLIGIALVALVAALLILFATNWAWEGMRFLGWGVGVRIIIGVCVGLFAGSLALLLVASFVGFLATQFANEKGYRKRALYVGASFFALSWVLQFAATYAP